MRLTGLARGLVAFVSLDEKEGGGVADLVGGWMELEVLRLIGPAWVLVAFLSPDDKGE